MRRWGHNGEKRKCLSAASSLVGKTQNNEKKNQTIWCKITRFRECHGTVITNSERPPKEIITKIGLNQGCV